MIRLSQHYGRLALAFAVALIPIALASASAFAQGSPVRVRGTVVSLEGTKLVVHAKDGKDITRQSERKLRGAGGGEILDGGHQGRYFIGTATVTQPDSSLRSLEVVVFPDKMRGTGEGPYPWDLGSSSMMTNATVSNAVKGIEGQTITVTYKGGEKKIDVPANVPVVTIGSGTKEEIKPGAIVFVPTMRQADDSLKGGAVLFGKDGVVPPM